MDRLTQEHIAATYDKENWEETEWTWQKTNSLCKQSYRYRFFVPINKVQIKGPEISLSYKQPLVGTQCVLVHGQTSLNRRQWFWEIETTGLRENACVWGIGKKKEQCHSYDHQIGQGESWGMDNYGFLLAGNNYGLPASVPNRELRSKKVQILFDGVLGTLTYFREGKKVGVRSSLSHLDLITSPLYPCISMTHTTHDRESIIKAKFINVRVQFPPLTHLARKAIIPYLKRKKSVSQLELPICLRKFLIAGLTEIDNKYLIPVNPRLWYKNYNFEENK